MKNEDAIYELESIAHTESKWPGTENKLEALDMAIKSLQAQAERDNPKPLSLEELREMFGSPVWIVQGNESNPEETETVLVELFGEERGYITFFQFGNEVEDGLLTEHYGKTWLAYRYKPKEAQHECFD